MIMAVFVSIHSHRPSQVESMMPFGSLQVVARTMQITIMKTLRQRAMLRMILHLKLMLTLERSMTGREIMRRSVKMSRAVVAYRYFSSRYIIDETGQFP
jgi:hypothetical protein